MQKKFYVNIIILFILMIKVNFLLLVHVIKVLMVLEGLEMILKIFKKLILKMMLKFKIFKVEINSVLL